MGLNPRGRGRGSRGGKGNFPNKSQRGGRMVGQGPMFRGGPPGMFCPPPMGFPPEPPFGGGPFFPGPSAFNFGPPRPGFGKFSRKNFKRRNQPKSNETPLPEIDLTKPWVTDEIKTEESKKQDLLETWRKSKNDEDWSKYKSQKEIVKNLYDKAKDEYLASHQEEAHYWAMVMATSQTKTEKKHYCETCDKAFKTGDDLLWHENEHEVCGREGCEFTAHPKVIAKHVQMQHRSGLFRRIGKLYTDEEIAKWIEERKKRYPSRKVIEEKKALEEERKKRGEKINEDKSIFNKSFQKKYRTSTRVTNKMHRNRRLFNKRKKSKIVENAMEEEAAANRRTVPSFFGIGSENNSTDVTETTNVDLAISDDEWDFEDSKQPSTFKPFVNQSLSLLASAYDSSEDDLGETKAQKENCLSQNINGNSQNDGDDDAPEEVKTICKRDLDDKVSEEKSQINSNFKRKNRFNKKNFGNKKKGE